MTKRCLWVGSGPAMIAYHDEEWGVPQHDDCKLFEGLILSGMQAGLSWQIVLKKRENFRAALAGFDPERLASFTEKKIKRLLADPGIIRNALKLHAAVHNARRVLEVSGEFGSFDKFLWRFVGERTIHNRFHKQSQIPATSERSDALSAVLRERGFKFIGSTICYAFIQASGLVNDHLTGCFRYRQLRQPLDPK